MAHEFNELRFHAQVNEALVITERVRFALQRHPRAPERSLASFPFPARNAAGLPILTPPPHPTRAHIPRPPPAPPSPAQVLGTARKPQLAEDVPHTYTDKYHLAEAQMSAAVASSLTALQRIGLSPEALRTLVGWSAGGAAVSLRFTASTTCAFLREATRDVASDTKVTTTTTGLGAAMGLGRATTTQVTTTVHEFFWRVGQEWALVAFRGTGRGEGDVLPLSARAGAAGELMTGHKSAPHAAQRCETETPITWLLQQLQADAGWCARVSINRGAKKCATPRRNEEADRAMEFLAATAAWVGGLSQHMGAARALWQSTFRPPAAPPGLPDLTSGGVLVPSLLFEEAPPPAGGGNGGGNNGGGAPAAAGGPFNALAPPPAPAPQAAGGGGALVPAAPPPRPALLDLPSLNRLLDEGFRGLEGRCAGAAASLPPAAGDALFSGAEAAFFIADDYLRRVADHCHDGLSYVEHLLRTQLVAAIGREVGPIDFAAYMRFHARRLFRAAYEPRAFCFSARRSPAHTPEGTIRIEAPPAGDAAAPEPIVTVSAAAPASPARPMSFALSAETSVTFGGTRHLHAWLSHKFGPSVGAYERGRRFPPPPALTLSAAARQFSCFVLLVGRISSATTFDPVSAVIVKDKDELAIPLSLSELPTPKEFKDAIASLSPEQQRFAKAFRAMQLESTLFGVLVLHIKPQLEKLLNLEHDALTKEVALQQELMDLFIKYQIPADLLSAPEDAPPARGKLDAVKANVAAVRAMIKRQEDEDIAHRAKEELYARPLAAFDAPQMDCAVPEMAMMMASAPAPPPQAMPKMMMRRGAAPMMAASAMAMPAMMRGGGGGGSGGGGGKGSAAGGFGAPEARRAAPPPIAAMPSSRAEAERTNAISAIASTGASASGGGGGGGGGGGAAPRPVPAPGSAAAGAGFDGEDGEEEPARDLTKVPVELDGNYERLDPDSALRATIIAPSGAWTKKSWASILSKEPRVETLGSDEQKTARAAAFDLLDALSRSGALPMEHAALHVVMGAMHSFDESLIETVVQKNINPIEKVERSMLIMAST
jgi:hypothetical protein